VISTVLELLAVIGIVFAVNLLPAFGPPTWALLAFARFHWHDIPPAALIAGGALASTAGRLVLAVGARKLGGRLSAKRRSNLQALGETLAKSKTGLVASLAMFAFSPLPSAQMFMAAGLADIPLLPLAGAFFIGRSVSYTIYVTAATAAEETIKRLLRQGLTSPAAIAIQVASLAAVVLMIKIDWIKIIDWTRARIARMRGKPPPPSVRPPDMDLPSGGATPKPT
jgi:membrane protein YqaA with SNARE-associated domain